MVVLFCWAPHPRVGLSLICNPEGDRREREEQRRRDEDRAKRDEQATPVWNAKVLTKWQTVFATCLQESSKSVLILCMVIFRAETLQISNDVIQDNA